jgi:pimeloyl-ACP methyl ester carboxylesterase
VLTLAGDVHEVLSAYVALFPACGALAIDQSLRLGAFQESLRALEPMLRGDQVRFDDAMTMVFESLRGPLDDEQWRRLTVLRRLDQDVVLVIWSSVFDLAPDELDTMVDAMTRAIGVPFLAVHGTDPGEDYEQWLDDRVATARVERWPDRGHYPHLAEPDRFLATLDDFERSLPRAVVRVAAGEVSRRSALASVA